jgi:cbb3-type cytochrome oxidase subunit 1
MKSRGDWLSQPATIRKLWLVFGALLGVTVLAQLAFPTDGYFGIDGWFGFGAVFGFIVCVLMVFGAKVLGWLIKRPDDYYDD